MSEKANDAAVILDTIYEAIKTKGYDPVKQIAGYILSEDPTYIPDYKGARGMIRHLGRDEMLKIFIESYFDKGDK
jgi:uncharacterized protein (UPF0297 family)